MGTLEKRTEGERAAYMEGYEAGKRDAIKTGKWRYEEDKSRAWDRWRYYCTACGGWNTYGMPDYCPRCGAKMVSENEH